MNVNFSQQYLSNLSSQLKGNRSARLSAITLIDDLFNITPQNEALQTWNHFTPKHNNIIILRWYQLMRLKYPQTKLTPSPSFSHGLVVKLNKCEQLTMLHRRLCQPFFMRNDHLNNNYQSRQAGLAEIEKELLKLASPNEHKQVKSTRPHPLQPN